jgi:choline dehydrogenase
VSYRRAGGTFVARARGEVILCAGAIQSPQLLELSGIGDPEVLSAQGVPVLQGNPSVGTNLRDHPHTRLSFRIRDGLETFNTLYPSLIGKARMALRLLLAGNGLMSCSGQIVHALTRSEPHLRQTDVKIQLHWLSSPDARDPRNLVLDPHPGVSIGTFMLRPFSRGSVHIRSKDVADHPEIHSNYFTDPEDRRAAIAAVRLARRVAAQPALAPFQLTETRPGADAQSDDEVFDFITRTAQTSYHPIGSCRMGGDAQSVVDERLRVRGVDGLRVADASVMPTMCSSNTNAASIVIGEKAARMIVEDLRR